MCTGAAESTAPRLLRSNGSSPVERNKAFDENSASVNGKTNGNSVADRGGISPRVGTRSSHAAAAAMAMAKSGETAAAGKGQGRGAVAIKHQQEPPEPKMVRAARMKSRMRGPGGGQRPAVQAPVSTPQGKTGGGPGSFCSKVRSHPTLSVVWYKMASGHCVSSSSGSTLGFPLTLCSGDDPGDSLERGFRHGAIIAGVESFAPAVSGDNLSRIGDGLWIIIQGRIFLP